MPEAIPGPPSASRKGGLVELKKKGGVLGRRGRRVGASDIRQPFVGYPEGAYVSVTVPSPLSRGGSVNLRVGSLAAGERVCMSAGGCGPRPGP